MEIFNLICVLFASIVLVLFIVLILKIISGLERRFPMPLTIKKRLWGISFVFVVLTPFIIPMRIASKEQFDVLAFGFPLKFIQQHTDITLLNRVFPFYTTIINPFRKTLLSSMNFRVDLFFYSVVCTYVILFLIRLMISKRKVVKR